MLKIRAVMRFSGMSALLACAALLGCSDTPDEEIRESRGSWGARELPVGDARLAEELPLE